jgi:hypothetical protein
MIDSVIAAIAALGAALGPLADFRGHRRDSRNRAIRDVSRALTETQIYLERVELGYENERSVREHLVRLWREAAISIRPFDEGLSYTCEHKAEFWLNPESWNATPEVNRHVQIERVLEQYRNLL